VHDETLPQEALESTEVCSMCGRKLCSMEVHTRLAVAAEEEGERAVRARAAEGPLHVAGR